MPQKEGTSECRAGAIYPAVAVELTLSLAYNSCVKHQKIIKKYHPATTTATNHHPHACALCTPKNSFDGEINVVTLR